MREARGVAQSRVGCVWWELAVGRTCLNQREYVAELIASCPIAALPCESFSAGFNDRIWRPPLPSGGRLHKGLSASPKAIRNVLYDAASTRAKGMTPRTP